MTLAIYADTPIKAGDTIAVLDSDDLRQAQEHPGDPAFADLANPVTARVVWVDDAWAILQIPDYQTSTRAVSLLTPHDGRIYIDGMIYDDAEDADILAAIDAHTLTVEGALPDFTGETIGLVFA